MSARAAWRLEALGFGDVYDYAASKADWFACGQPREGLSTEVPWAGDLARDVATCSPDERVGEVRERVVENGSDLCVVVNEERIVVGLLRGDALAKDEDAHAGEVMELGSKTIRPSTVVDELLRRRSSQGVKSWVVTTSHGVLLGRLTRDEAERALAVSRASAGQ
jgi:CBS-domain-containing membrane protein